MVKNLPINAGDVSSIPGSGRSPRKGNGNPPQYSCLGNPIDKGALWAAVHGVTKSWTRASIENNRKLDLLCKECRAIITSGLVLITNSDNLIIWRKASHGGRSGAKRILSEQLILRVLHTSAFIIRQQNLIQWLRLQWPFLFLWRKVPWCSG